MTAAQRATLKFMAVAALLFLGQTLIGGGVAHYRAEPGEFLRHRPVGIPAQQPAAHLASAAGDLLDRDRPMSAARCSWRACSAAASLPGSAPASICCSSPSSSSPSAACWANGPACCNGSAALWFWFGNQGWEYPRARPRLADPARHRPVFWFWLLWRNVAPARRDPERRGLVTFFLIAAAAIPLFYLPALFFDGTTHYTIVDTWRFWIIHLWVEGFFELFVTVIVAIIFYQLGLVERDHRAARHLSRRHPGLRRRPDRHRPSLVFHRPDASSTWRCRRLSRRSRSCR